MNEVKEIDLIIERYGIRKVAYEMHSPIDRGILYIVDDENQLTEEVLEQMPKCITRKEIENLQKAKELVLPHIPMLINTIENTYLNIAVYGQSEYAEEIYQYLHKNKNIRVVKVSKEQLFYTENKYLLKCEQSVDIFIVLDLLTVKKVYDAQGNKVLSVFAKKMYDPGLKSTENNFDINFNIIPRLLDHSVDVIWIGVPEIERLNNKSKIGRTMKLWTMLRNTSSKLYTKVRQKLFHSYYLYKESISIYNSNIKGISENFYNGKYINFENGFRYTPGNNVEVENNVWLFGPCYVRGINFDDNHTMSAKLQKMIKGKYNVINRGTVNTCLNYVMRMSEFKKGDVIVFFSPEKIPQRRDERIVYLDMTDILNTIPQLERHITDSVFHCDGVVIDAIVQSVYKEIVKKKTYEGKKEIVFFGSAVKREPSIKMYDRNEYVEWLEQLKEYKREGNNGAIVMNANPFTQGHLYLAEYAAEQVDNLYIFVVQEDKSYFSFEDRLRLVEEGTKHLKNVIVLPSSQYIISSSSLPGYFKKEDMSGDFKLDATQDLISFVQAANVLGVKTRFAGEEPKDYFTRQYNENMNKILPRYGMGFVVIQRKEMDQQVISASLVRKYFINDEMEKIKNIVPETTYQKLMQMKSALKDK